MTVSSKKQAAVMYLIFTLQADILAIIVSVIISSWISLRLDPFFVSAAPLGEIPFVLLHLYLLIPVWIGVFCLLNFYNSEPFPHCRSLYQNLKGATFSVLSLIVLSYFSDFEFPRSTALLCWVISVAVFSLTNVLSFRLLRKFRIRMHSGSRTAIVGTDWETKAIGSTVVEESLLQDEFCGYIINGMKGDLSVDDVLGQLDDLEYLIRAHCIHRILIYRSAVSHSELMDITAVCEKAGIDFFLIPDVLDSLPVQTNMCRIGNVPLIRMRRVRIGYRQQLVKRVLDVAAVLVGGVILLPLMAVTALCIRLESPGPVIYKQQRVGKDGKVFAFYKFRSMIMDADSQRDRIGRSNHVDQRLYKVKNDPRVTRVGKIIRKLSIDELPQIWNVLIGDMALVGPRPLPVADVEKACLEPENAYWYRQRNNVRPGITGMWQIRGRSDLSFQEMVKYDMYYILNWSLALDLKILLKTVPAVLLGRGAY